MTLLTEQDGGGSCNHYGEIMERFGAFTEKEKIYDGHEKRICALEKFMWGMLGIGGVVALCLVVFGWLLVSMNSTMNKLLEMHLHDEFQATKEAVVVTPPSLEQKLTACIYNPIKFWRR